MQGLRAVVLKQLPGKPKGYVDDRTKEIFLNTSVVKALRTAGCTFPSVEVYVDGRWRHLVVGSRFDE